MVPPFPPLTIVTHDYEEGEREVGGRLVRVAKHTITVGMRIGRCAECWASTACVGGAPAADGDVR